MLGFPNAQVGDCWFFIDPADPSTCHAYLLTCPKDLPRHARWDIGHATSTNLADWTYHGPVLSPGSPSDFDGACPATGSILLNPFADSPQFVMAYTGNWAGPNPSVGLAFSDDLHRWTKSPLNPVTQPAGPHYETARTHHPTDTFPHWRDPFLFTVPDDPSHVYHAVCAALPQDQSPPDAYPTGNATIGIARTADFAEWELMPPPTLDPICDQMECPQVVRVADDRWALVFSMPHATQAPLGIERFGDHNRKGTYAMLAPSPLGPFTFPHPFVLQFDRVTTPTYAGQAVRFHGEWFMLGTTDDDIDSVLADPLPITWRFD